MPLRVGHAVRAQLGEVRDGVHGCVVRGAGPRRPRAVRRGISRVGRERRKQFGVLFSHSESERESGRGQTRPTGGPEHTLTSSSPDGLAQKLYVLHCRCRRATEGPELTWKRPRADPPTLASSSRPRPRSLRPATRRRARHVVRAHQHPCVSLRTQSKPS